MTKNIRRQLTLFVDPKDAKAIEQIRKEYNAIQFDLIKSHVTLCREDEIENLEHVLKNLLLLTQTEISIEFAEAKRFDNGKGLLLPATSDNAEFQELRRQVLVGLSDNPKKQEPHITLMHPRNSTCTDSIFRQLEKIELPKKIKFKRISLIEQQDGGKWDILKNFDLKSKP